MITNINLLPKKRKASKGSSFSLSLRGGGGGEGFDAKALAVKLFPWLMLSAVLYLGVTFYLQYTNLKRQVTRDEADVKVNQIQVNNLQATLAKFAADNPTVPGLPTVTIPTTNSQTGRVLEKINTAARSVGGDLYKVTYVGDSISLECLVPNDDATTRFGVALQKDFEGANIFRTLAPKAGVLLTIDLRVKQPAGGGAQ